jgi:hypothetical protein
MKLNARQRVALRKWRKEIDGFGPIDFPEESLSLRLCEWVAQQSSDYPEGLCVEMETDTVSDAVDFVCGVIGRLKIGFSVCKFTPPEDGAMVIAAFEQIPSLIAFTAKMDATLTIVPVAGGGVLLVSIGASEEGGGSVLVVGRGNMSKFAELTKSINPNVKHFMGN